MQNIQIEVKTVLIGAAGVMRARGLARGPMQDTLNRVCTRGAIRRWLAENVPFTPETEDVWRTACDRAERSAAIAIGGSEPHHLGFWSDRLCSGTEEAAALLERAASNGEKQAASVFMRW